MHNHGHYSKSFLILLLAVLTMFFTVQGYAETPQLETSFQPSPDAMADVDAALEAARAEDKLALIIMGANWCHDSRGLVEHFADPELAVTLDEDYETLLVDVGLLNQGMDVIKRYGMPVIYGTPTVLIVDPKTGRLLNKSTMFQWRNSASIPVEDARAYFAAMTDGTNWDAPPEEPSPDLAALYAEIDAFEEVQADRIYKGFEIIGPMLGLDGDERPDRFTDYWRQLADLRYTITDDLARLRAEAREKVSAGETDITLDFPEYPAFDWERESSD